MVILFVIAVIAALATAAGFKYKVFNFQVYDEQDETITPNLSPMPTEPSQSSQAAPDARVQPPVVPTDRVQTCALAQQAFEGWYLPGSVHGGVPYPKGSPSFQRNNPGNCMAIDDSGKAYFIHFETYEEGFAYLEQYIRDVATGKKPKLYPHLGATTIMQYTHIYTGDPEPSPTNYAHAIAAAVGLSTAARMDALLS